MKLPGAVLVFIAIISTVASDAVAAEIGAKEELFTAQVELESLFDTEEGVIEVFERYIAKEEARLREIKRRLLPFTEIRRKAVSEVVGNPINAFLLVKGLTVDLDDMTTVVNEQRNINGELQIEP